jgi:hypothetical protein
MSEAVGVYICERPDGAALPEALPSCQDAHQFGPLSHTPTWVELMTWLPLLWRCSCLRMLDLAQHPGSLLIIAAGERGQIIPVREAKIAAEGPAGAVPK